MIAKIRLGASICTLTFPLLVLIIISLFLQSILCLSSITPNPKSCHNLLACQPKYILQFNIWTRFLCWHVNLNIYYYLTINIWTTGFLWVLCSKIWTRFLCYNMGSQVQTMKTIFPLVRLSCVHNPSQPCNGEPRAVGYPFTLTLSEVPEFCVRNIVPNHC